MFGLNYNHFGGINPWFYPVVTGLVILLIVLMIGNRSQKH